MKRRHTANRITPHGNLSQSTIIDKEQLPKNLQNRMKKTGAQTHIAATGTDIAMGSPIFYQPLFQATNMLLPRDRRERNEWCRHFYRTEPIVATALDIHTEFPISGMNNVCSDAYIKDFFDYQVDKINMIDLLLQIGLEYWKIGDAFPMGQFNESNGLWETFTLLNPDFINVAKTIFAGTPQIELIPDEQITRIIQGGPNGEFGDLYRQFPTDVITQVKQGKNISLDSRLVSHIAHKASSYETWGTPILMRCFKTLIYKDKLRQAQDAIVNRHIFPIRVAKIGTPGEPMPSQEDIDSFRDTLNQVDADPNFFLVYHYGLSFEYVGSAGKLLPLEPEFEFIKNELMTGLCVTQPMLNGDGSAYANAEVGYDILAKRYMSYRLRLENWIRQKVYKPVAEVQGFYKPKNGTIATKFLSSKEKKRLADKKEMELIIPKIIWQHQDLTSNQTVMNFIQSLQDKGLVSMHTILPMLSLDPETEQRNLERERGTVFDVNAPQKGPLPNTIMQNQFSSGTTIRMDGDNQPSSPTHENPNSQVERDTTPATPVDEGGEPPTRGNNPADFGLPQ